MSKEELGGWRCLRCDWEQDTREPEPRSRRSRAGAAGTFSAPSAEARWSILRPAVKK